MDNGKAIMKRAPFIRVIPYFLLAILVHAFYNSLLSFETIGVIIGLFAALTFAGITIIIVRKKIKTLDETSG